MTEENSAAPPAPKGPKERSPGFPFIPLGAAVRRLEQFEAYFGRHPGKAVLAGAAWKMKDGSSKSQQTLAAVKAFGFLGYKGSGGERTAFITDLGRTYLRAQQDSIKIDALKKAALLPKAIHFFYLEWGADRPPDAVCLDKLVLEKNYTESAAPRFLKVYDETIAFAGLAGSDKGGVTEDEEIDTGGEDGVPDNGASATPPPPFTPAPTPTPPPAGGNKKVVLMENERVLTSGILSKAANFRVLVEGPVSDKEITRLIAKLEYDKEILADTDEDETKQ